MAAATALLKAANHATTQSIDVIYSTAHMVLLNV
jgi:hypothetical protein